MKSLAVSGRDSSGPIESTGSVVISIILHGHLMATPERFLYGIVRRIHSSQKIRFRLPIIIDVLPYITLYLAIMSPNCGSPPMRQYTDVMDSGYHMIEFENATGNKATNITKVADIILGGCVWQIQDRCAPFENLPELLRSVSCKIHAYFIGEDVRQGTSCYIYELYSILK